MRRSLVAQLLASNKLSATSQFAALIASDSQTKVLILSHNSNSPIVHFHATRYARRRDNIFLQSVIVSMINVLGSRCVESRSSFDYYPFVYLTSMLDTFPTDPVLLTSALTSMFFLCSQCPLQRKHGFDAGAVAKVVEVVNSWRRDWRVVNAGVKALTGLCCRCGSNKNIDEEEAVVVPLVLDILQEYSQDNCLESADVCGVVSRSCFLLIKSLTSKDDDGLTETFSYEQYLEEGGER